MDILNTVIAFASSHWILSTIFILLVIAFFINEGMSRKFGILELKAEDAIDLMNHHEAEIIDIRPQTSFQEGHILGSRNIQSAMLASKWTSLQKYQESPLIIVCNLGQEARKVAALFQKNQFKRVYVLQGGLNAWRAAGLPLTKKA